MRVWVDLVGIFAVMQNKILCSQWGMFFLRGINATVEELRV